MPRTKAEHLAAEVRDAMLCAGFLLLRVSVSVSISMERYLAIGRPDLGV